MPFAGGVGGNWQWWNFLYFLYSSMLLCKHCLSHGAGQEWGSQPVYPSSTWQPLRESRTLRHEVCWSSTGRSDCLFNTSRSFSCLCPWGENACWDFYKWQHRELITRTVEPTVSGGASAAVCDNTQEPHTGIKITYVQSTRLMVSPWKCSGPIKVQAVLMSVQKYQIHGVDSMDHSVQLLQQWVHSSFTV